jgi:hypothetical protein
MDPAIEEDKKDDVQDVDVEKQMQETEARIKEEEIVIRICNFLL